MSKNQPRCHCGGEMKRNGTTSKGTTRWRCKQCGASSVKRRNDITNAAVFTQFIEHCTTAISLDDLAKRNGVSRATMKRRFKWCWLVDVPDPTAGHHKRIYDQVFLDGTYTAGGCLIVAATIDHVIAWHWCKHETTRDYQLLLERIEAHSSPSSTAAKAHTAQSKSAGRLRKFNAASSTPNAWSAATPPPTHAPMPGAPSTDLR